jgi:hypothetical protein
MSERQFTLDTIADLTVGTRLCVPLLPPGAGNTTMIGEVVRVEWEVSS